MTAHDVGIAGIWAVIDGPYNKQSAQSRGSDSIAASPNYASLCPKTCGGNPIERALPKVFDDLAAVFG
jgi:hypothetical protein